MFIVASTGRCGTQAVCDAFEQFTDHRVRHEPEPLLLEEAYRAYHHRWRVTPTYLRRMLGFRKLDGTAYGESVRCPTLLDDLARFAPRSRFVVLFRSPGGYVRSAWGRGVLRKGGPWDRWRILPAEAEGRDVVDRIALHYAEVNRLLADTVERLGDRALVLEVGELDEVVDAMATFTGAVISDRAGMADLLTRRPNAGGTSGWDADPCPEVSADVQAVADAAYARLRSLADS